MATKQPKTISVAFASPEGAIPIARIFKEEGYKIVEKPSEADIIVFPGGSDICPLFYGEKPIKETRYLLERDLTEVKLFRALEYNKPKVGICRGAQFLNVMCGGSLWQDVDGHRKAHPLVDGRTRKRIEVTSTHHQMMRPGRDAKIIAWAEMSSCRENEFSLYRSIKGETFKDDVEVVYYEHFNSLCFQPHPEYNHESTKAFFFDLIDDYILGTFLK